MHERGEVGGRVRQRLDRGPGSLDTLLKGHESSGCHAVRGHRLLALGYQLIAVLLQGGKGAVEPRNQGGDGDCRESLGPHGCAR